MQPFIALLLLLEAVILECSGTTTKNGTKIIIRRLSSTSLASKNGTTVTTRRIAETAMGRPRAAGFATNIGAPPINYASKFGAAAGQKYVFCRSKKVKRENAKLKFFNFFSLLLLHLKSSFFALKIHIKLSERG